MNKYEEHTPGPWEIHDEDEIVVWDFAEIDSGNGKRVASIWGMAGNFPTMEQAKANAHLIADAPALLAENERLRAVVAAVANQSGSLAYDAIRKMAQAALAKGDTDV